MNPLDIVIVVVVLYCLIRGILRGVLREFFSLLGILGGLYTANLFTPSLSQYLSRWISVFPSVNAVSFCLLFIGIFFVFSAVGVIVKYVTNINFPGWVERTLGGFLGTLRGVLMVSILLLEATLLLPKGSPMVRKSRLAPYAAAVSEKVAFLVSSDIRQEFTDQLTLIRKDWNHKK